MIKTQGNVTFSLVYVLLGSINPFQQIKDSLQSVRFQKKNHCRYRTYTDPFIPTVETFGNCQRPVSSLGVSQHAQNNKPVKIRTQLVVEVARVIEESHPCHTTYVVCFQMLDFGTSKSNSEVSKSNFVKITSFSKTIYFTGSCFSQCFILFNSSCYQVSFYAINYFGYITNSVQCL